MKNNDGFVSDMTGEELMSQNVTEIPMLVEDIMPRVSLGGFIGESDALKSTSLLHLCELIIANDTLDIHGNVIPKKFLNWKIYPQHHRALYYSTEDDPIGLGNRIITQNMDMNLSREELSRLDVCFDFGDDFLQNLQEKLDKQKYDIVIIDGWEDIFTGDSYNNVQVRTYLSPIKEMAHMYATNILLLNHIGKRTAELMPNKNHALGSQAWEAKMRYVFQWSKDRKEDDICWFTIVKGNYIPSKFKKQAYTVTVSKNLTFSSDGSTQTLENMGLKDENLQRRQDEYNKIIQMRNDGRTWKQIAKNFGVSEEAARKKFTRLKNVADGFQGQIELDFTSIDTDMSQS